MNCGPPAIQSFNSASSMKMSNFLTRSNTMERKNNLFWLQVRSLLQRPRQAEPRCLSCPKKCRWKLHWRSSLHSKHLSYWEICCGGIPKTSHYVSILSLSLSVSLSFFSYFLFFIFLSIFLLPVLSTRYCSLSVSSCTWLNWNYLLYMLSSFAYCKTFR